MSPLRIKRIQDYQIVEESRSTNTMHSAADEKTKDAEEAEADRALTVVSKKLSKTLSVSATVNELIQVAADERKLALLYSGMFYALVVPGRASY